MRFFTLIFLSAIIFLQFSCTSTRHSVTINESSDLKFLDEFDVPYNFNFKNTVVGGLSGIDYDQRENSYYLISDDRSEKNPARFYKAQIIIDKNKIDTVIFDEVVTLKNNVGKPYPNSHNDPYRTPDPEALRHDPRKNILIWSSEGERIVRDDKKVLEDPSITEIDPAGNYVDTFTLPNQLRMQATESGPRQNSVFEGLTFADDYKTLFVNVEEPLYNDGSRAGLDDSTGIIRILKFDMRTKKPVAQYAYLIDPVAHPPVPANGFKINGVPDILSIGDNKLLVIERSFSTGRMACTIKIYVADLSGATDVNNISSLRNESNVKLISKKLLLNMDSLGIYIDNIEGVTFGPRLSNGKSSLLFIADNNFNPLEKTQVLLFQVD